MLSLVIPTTTTLVVPTTIFKPIILFNLWNQLINNNVICTQYTVPLQSQISLLAEYF